MVISPEEVSQELLAAVLTGDPKRFEALLITPAELTAMGLPKAETGAASKPSWLLRRRRSPRRARTSRG